MPWMWSLLYCVTLLLPASAEDVAKTNAEARLRSTLLQHYNKTIRPVKHHTNTTVVSVGLFPIFLTELDEVRQILTLEAWVILTWNDDHLTWDPSHYDGIHVLRVPRSDLWLPDVTLYNYHTPLKLDPLDNTLLLLYPDGSIIWVPPATISTVCPLHLEEYPYDLQTCSFKFASWAHDGWAIDMDVHNSDLSDFWNTNEVWKAVSIHGQRNVKYYSCCEEPYPDVTFNLQLERRPPPDIQMETLVHWVVVLLCTAMLWATVGSMPKILLGMAALFLEQALLVSTAGRNQPAAIIRSLEWSAKVAMVTVASAILVQVLLASLIKNMSSRPLPGMLANISNITGCITCIPQEGNISLVEEGKEDADLNPRSHFQYAWFGVSVAIERIFSVIVLIVFLSSGILT